MKRTLLLSILGVAISFLFAFGGHWLVYKLINGTGGSYKDDFVTISLTEILILFPAMSLLIGAIQGWLQPKKYWWVAGISLLPLFGYLLYDSGGNIGPLLFYMIMTLASAFIISWLKYRRKAQV